MARSIPSRTRTNRGAQPRGGKVRSLPVPALPLHGPDGLLAVTLAGLISVGMIMVYSATIHQSTTDEIIRKMGMQFGIGAVGLLLGLVMPVQMWRRLMPVILGGVLLTLISLLIPGNPFAVTRLHATRWIGLGTFTIQPSEFAKLAFILFAAEFLHRRGPKMGLLGPVRYWVGYLLVLLSMVGLIYLEPDLGTALVIGGTAFCLLWISGVNWKPLVVGVLLAAIAVGAAASQKEHQRARLMSWWNPWAYHQKGGHQVIQSWTALARGGLYGVGLGQSLQKLDDRLPEAETDFIFAVVAEELGLFRALGVLLLYLLFVWRGYAIAARAPDRYLGLVAAGVTSWIGVQTALNLGVITGTLPNTGVPLPFLSSGGSSLLALLMAVGILLSISRYTVPKKEAAQ